MHRLVHGGAYGCGYGVLFSQLLALHGPSGRKSHYGICVVAIPTFQTLLYYSLTAPRKRSIPPSDTPPLPCGNSASCRPA